MNLSKALGALVTVSFVNLVVQRGWEAALGFVVALSFSAFIVWLNPERKKEVSREEFDKVREGLESTRDQLTQLRVKIGFQRSA